ncbi:NAD(P)-binding domain-containing protein [Fibrella aestuarina]|nr:NAD(P)-binding domain-containing protein [Fibrella aestuarina]
MNTSKRTCSLIGLGWLGLPLAERLLTLGYRVSGSTTTPDKVATLRHKGIHAIELRLSPAPEGDLPTLLDTDVLVVNVPPRAGQFGDQYHPEQMRLLAEAVRGSRIQHIIYVSSTSVYPELSRDVYEEDVQSPAQSAAPALATAEQYWLALAPERAVTVVRCAGLMGGSRIPGKYVAGRTVESGTLPVNYLHQVDAVGLLSAVIEQGLAGTFNAVAPQHPTREAVYRQSCAAFGYAEPTFVTPDKPLPFKRINGDRLTQATAYRFVYPDPLSFPYQP